MDSLAVEMETREYIDRTLYLDFERGKVHRIGMDFVRWRRNRQLKDIDWLHSIMKAWSDAALRSL